MTVYPIDMESQDKIMNAISVERERQEKLWADGTHGLHLVDLDLADSCRLAILTEEVGEVAKEVTEYESALARYRRDPLVTMPAHREQYFRDQMRKELIQVAAVCVAWCEALDMIDADESDAVSLGRQDEDLRREAEHRRSAAVPYGAVK